jgi:hypothetical protein
MILMSAYMEAGVVACGVSNEIRMSLIATRDHDTQNC